MINGKNKKISDNFFNSFLKTLLFAIIQLGLIFLIKPSVKNFDNPEIWVGKYTFSSSQKGPNGAFINNKRINCEIGIFGVSGGCAFKELDSKSVSFHVIYFHSYIGSGYVGVSLIDDLTRKVFFFRSIDELIKDWLSESLVYVGLFSLLVFWCLITSDATINKLNRK